MKALRVSKIVSALLLAVFLLSAFAVPPAQAQQGNTIVDVVLATNAETGEFSILIAALQAAKPDVIRRLSSEKESTVFAPTDAAFLALLDELGLTADQLLASEALVSKVLRYHVVRGRLDATAVLASEQIRTFQGGLLYQDGGVLTDANGRTATIIATDIEAGNGVIHVIDRVVLPNLSSDGDDDDDNDHDE